jgi:Fe-S-cluster containining protein
MAIEYFCKIYHIKTMEEIVMDFELVEKLLRKGYALTGEVIANQLKEQNINVICSKRCSACCENMELSVLDIEMQLIKKYILTMVDSPIKDWLTKNIIKFDHNQPGCPFLVNKVCSVYDVRPITCRVYYIQNRKCILGENIFKIRSNDIVQFDRKKLLDAIICLSSIYGFKDENLFRKKLEEGFFLKKTSSLYDYNRLV